MGKGWIDWVHGDSGWYLEGCHRSALAGPEQAAERLIAQAGGGVFQFLACSGATTKSLLGQLSQLRSGRIDALTVSIGGNDVDFAQTLISCNFAPPPVECFLNANVTDAVNSLLKDLPRRLATVFKAIPTNVKDVFVTEYPNPTTGPLYFRCGSFFAPGFQGFDAISEPEATWASQDFLGPLNRILSDAVDQANRDRANRPGLPVFHFVTGISSRFETHGYCTGGGGPNLLWWFWPRFVATLVDSLTDQADPNGAMHPNDLGQRAIADALVDAMGFLIEEPFMSVSTSPKPPMEGEPAKVVVWVGTHSQHPIVGGMVAIDGTQLGTTDSDGRFETTWMFPTSGLHTVSVDTGRQGVVSFALMVQVLQPLECRDLRKGIMSLRGTVKSLQAELNEAAPSQKHLIVQQIRHINAKIEMKQDRMKQLGCTDIP